MRRKLQPDLFVMPLLDGRQAQRFADVGRLLLAVEALSPSTANNDRKQKRAVYQEEGVPEYWIVDPEEKLVERWRPNDTEPEILVTAIGWHPLAAHPPLVIDLEALFRTARGEA